MKPEQKLFILYDERARLGEPEDAVVLDTAETEEEAKELRGDYPEGSLWVEYDVDSDGRSLINEKRREDIQC